MPFPPLGTDCVGEHGSFPDIGKMGRQECLPHIFPNLGNWALRHFEWKGRASLSERAVVGVAGYYRPEKGMDDLIELLKKINGCRDSRLPEFGILLGVPNPAAASHLKVETVCTATPAEYQDMLARCDVLVLNGERESYFYRASGPIADAATCGTAVVAPDFPIIGKQVAGIGEVFQGLETGSAGFSLPAALLRSLEAVKAGRYDFEAYCEARTANALASYLNRSNERSEWL